jgi:NRAMP (natural resistance-associated macrophage protein)-like metal ion transporter
MHSKIKKLFKLLGPGFITGASDDDPSGIATYSQTGAHFGYTQLWTAFFSLPLMTVVQEMCGRIGLVTGNGLARVIKHHYSRPVLYFSVSLLVIANTINIGADLGAMAAAAQLIFGLPFWFWLILITFTTLFLEIFVSYKTYSKYLKYLTFSLFAYVITVFVVKQNWAQIFVDTFKPSFEFNKEYILNIVAILGTTISPYLFFWQTSEEVEEEIEKHKIKDMDLSTPKFSKRDIKNMREDTTIGMFFSNLVMFFIIVTTASTLGKHGVSTIQTAAQAAEALRPLAGDFTFILFASGIIGTGLLAVPILAGSASYAISESFNWKEGLSKKLKKARGFYSVIAVATLVGLLVNFTSIKPFQMLYYTAILNGICAPPLLILILLIANNKKILGKNTNTFISNFLGFAVIIIMSAAVLGLLWFSLHNPIKR